MLHDPELHYLDNAATTPVPAAVADAMYELSLIHI